MAMNWICLRPCAWVDTRDWFVDVTPPGDARSWLLATAYPLFVFLSTSRKKFTARVHWLDWSTYLITPRPL